MDRKSSPERSSPGTGTSTHPLHTVHHNDNDMAAAVAVSPPAEPGSAANKRYRPAPAKTFQCRGYGDCRMVFSRSEHLARHIRKHTGERPFTCHCSKQFSRLDNLRQHAQTVHADKQDQNERMMRDLTSLHASMAAANKIGGANRGRRNASSASAASQPAQSASPTNENVPIPNSNGHSGHSEERTASPMEMVKQEDLAPITYDPSELYHPSQAWHTDIESPKYFQPTLTFNGTGGSRPTTSERLPPLSTIVSGSIPTPQQHQASQQQQSQAYGSSFPAHLRPRPGTANRPSSSSSNSATSFYPNPNLPTSALSSTTTSKSFYPTPPALQYPRGYGSNGYDGPSDGSSPTGGAPPASSEASPFYFAPPAPADQRPAPSPPSSTSSNPRKRAFAGPDGPVHSYNELSAYSTPHHPQHPHNSQHPAHAHQHLDYDYGSESRPQSRRLSVMELCNDGTSEFVDGFLVNGERPTTATASALGLVGSTAALGLFDRPQERPPQQQQRASPVGSGSGRSEGGGNGGGRMSPPSRRVTPHINGNGAPTANGVATNGNGPTNGITNGVGNGYAPPPRPHSTAFSVSSTSSTNSPPIGHHHPSYASPAHFYPQHPQQHPGHPHHAQQQQQQQQQQHQASYSTLGMMTMHHGYSPAPSSASASLASPTYYSPRSASVSSATSFSPRVGGGGHMAHQQAQAFQAMQAQAQAQYGHHGQGYGNGNGHGGYEAYGGAGYAA
ncbi:hypothetical protein DXG01_005811 [Tephrocybe rancida]|nr:hypothetical protein DXG01_005811 [Tephrocybe rancida]